MVRESISNIIITEDRSMYSYSEDCIKNYGVRPSSRWITTEFGGQLGMIFIFFLPCLNMLRVRSVLAFCTLISLCYSRCQSKIESFNQVWRETLR
uniref:Uncharacterized protein n=1 Tax=Setaria italica TaxID=4555 RepID=K3ZCD6_SETIT